MKAPYIVSMIRGRELFYFSFPNKEYVWRKEHPIAGV